MLGSNHFHLTSTSTRLEGRPARVRKVQKLEEREAIYNIDNNFFHIFKYGANWSADTHKNGRCIVYGEKEHHGSYTGAYQGAM